MSLASQSVARPSPMSSLLQLVPSPSLSDNRLERSIVFLFFALLAIGTARIVSTYRVFSQTFDEPAHIACGMQWLDRGVYLYEPQHPPLARVRSEERRVGKEWRTRWWRCH